MICEPAMKTRIRKVYDSWVVEFPFSVAVYCSAFDIALEALNDEEYYLLDHHGALPEGWDA